MSEIVNLVHYNAMRTALIESHRIDEVKSIRDKAEALRQYARQAGESLENQNMIAEIKLRAERRAGELLKEMEKAKPTGSNQYKQDRSHDVTDPPTLSDLGISKMQSSRWQNIAALPDEVFEKHIAETKESHKELTSAGTLKLSMNHQKHAERAEMGKRESVIPDGVHLYNAPFQEVCADLPDGSVDLIFTDPPYLAEHLPLWYDLAAIAKRVLRPGGILLSYSGEMFLPDCMAALGEFLQYVWIGGVRHSQGYTQIWRYEILAAWKPILIYANGEPDRTFGWMIDMISGGQGDKVAHKWSQPESEAAQFIEKVTRRGEVVLDPMMGSGTIPRAAHKLGRIAIGCEIDKGNFDIAKGLFDA